MRQEPNVFSLLLPCLVVSRVNVGADCSSDRRVESVGQNCFRAFGDQPLFFDRFSDHLPEDDKFVNELINVEADPDPGNAMLTRDLRP
jgi:hypothetical protein